MTKLRREVLRLYRQIIQISRTWESLNVSDLTTERNYIKTEARNLFKKNKNVSENTSRFVKKLVNHDIILGYMTRDNHKIIMCCIYQLSDEADIKKCLDEANARIELGTVNLY